MPHDKVDHGESHARRNGGYEGDALKNVELGIAKGEDSLEDESS